MDGLIDNCQSLEQELGWLRSILQARRQAFLAAQTPQEAAATAQPGAAPASPPTGAPPSVLHLTPPSLQGDDSPYARFVRHYGLSFAERLALILSLTPHIRPGLLDVLAARLPGQDRRPADFGGVLSPRDGSFTPTGETLAFLLGADDLGLRFSVQRLFAPSHFFAKHGILGLSAPPQEDLPAMKAPLRISEDTLSLLTLGEPRQIRFGVDFPAQRIETQLTLADVVLPASTRGQIEEIQTWIEHEKTLMQEWEMAAYLRPGFRCLFYGPPGTGKTITACVLGNATGREVYKVDLSLVMSKYIGETEKNLSRVFDYAEHRRWILFFDEADALFGKRSQTRDAHDRYANQEVSFLLQRIESFDGIVILASNLRDNIDDAFARRFESVIHFPIPRSEERARLWRLGVSSHARLAADVDLDKLAEEHALPGGAIMNIVRYASLQAIKEGRAIRMEDLRVGIRREYEKEGKGI